jgi:hypothetical protein
MRKFVFADEAGDFDSRRHNVSRYFIYKGFPIRQAKMLLARTAGYRFSPDF